MQEEFFGTNHSGKTVLKIPRNGASNKSAVPDPAFFLPGLMWNEVHINAPDFWQKSFGDPAVRVAVADTGIDYTHVDLAGQVDTVTDFTLAEVPPICKTFFGGFGDDDLALAFGAPSSNLDFNGHGSWIAGNIAAELNGTGVNGIAPSVKLEALKISQWCGSAYDSTILNAFVYAAQQQFDVVSISFGGYLDRTDPAQDAIYQLYVPLARWRISASPAHTR